MATIKVSGMSCQHCVDHVTKALEGLPGVKNVHVDLSSGEATFDNPDSVASEDIARAIEDAGYEVMQAS